MERLVAIEKEFGIRCLAHKIAALVAVEPFAKAGGVASAWSH
jgi:hypothetical protein